jgi:hypothetical protein
MMDINADPEQVRALFEDLVDADEDQLQIVAEWMIEHGWTESLGS